MDLKSIRWSLPLSYAGIALLAALALGAVMLFRLDGYYREREREFMESYAVTIQAALAPIDLKAIGPEVLQAQVDGFALFARSRIRLEDLEGRILADSGEVSAQAGNIGFSAMPAGQAGGANVIIFQGPEDSEKNLDVPNPPGISSQRILVSSAEAVPGELISGGAFVSYHDQVTVLPVFDTFAMVDPIDQAADSFLRSREWVEVPLYTIAGERVGKVSATSGPAYGRQIVNQVAQAWGLASVLAVLLAGGAGWLASKRITRPAGDMIAVTRRMAAGDLSARAGDLPTREFGALGQAFNHMAARIEETVVALRRFAADAAHELKTPLTTLRINLELAQPDEFVQRAQVQIGRLENLMNGLLDLSRLEGGEENLSVSLDLVALARETSEVFAARAEQAGVDFELDLPDTPVRVLGDPTRLVQALSNLLDNAVKFTPAGGRIRMGLAVEGDLVCLRVEDSGIGILPEDLPGLFERFHRGRNAGAYPGSGLGLAVVQAIAEHNGGRVSVESEPGHGSCFSFCLPVYGEQV
jgi:signal transduction histidine kinase